MKNKDYGPRFVSVYLGLLKDPDFNKMTYSAQMLYIRLRAKFKSKSQYPMQVELTQAEMQDIMPSRTMTRAIAELETSGFIKTIVHGRAFGHLKIKSVYQFTGKYAVFYVKGYKIT